MSFTNGTDLERALLRSGDDLYRLALLLADDEASAERALIKATRHLTATGAALDEPSLIAALLGALPPERQRLRTTRLPAWARPRIQAGDRADLLAALAALPRQQRLALVLTMVRSFEPDQVAVLLGEVGQRSAASAATASTGVSDRSPADRARAVVRDALLALSGAVPALPLAALDSAGAPEDCRPTRVALALNDPALHTDAAIRGHLALCSACRAADHAWQVLNVAVEETLRGALRDTRLPPGLADQLYAAAQPAEASFGRALLANSRVRLALVALPVLALVAFLIWPRGATPAPTGRAPALDQAPAARELVQRARDQLYTPAAGQGVWHARYDIQWTFFDDTSALLAADVWFDPSSGKHRLQLVHNSGGGPYEFELADGAGRAWYAVSQNYVSSLYPLSYNNLNNRVELQATPEAQQHMLAARFQAGAWGIAGAYLRQAEGAELRAWGRQRDADGALLDLISFNGVSPLALPPDAPNATTSRVTVLLAIDEASGRLREVRELIGPAGSEQITRTTWREVSQQRLAADQATPRIFELRNAWNGIGDFSKIGQLVDPKLPLIQSKAVTSLGLGYYFGWAGVWMPSSMPPGAVSGMLVNQGGRLIQPNQFYANTELTFIYLGEGRRLEISTLADIAPRLIGGEVVSLDDRQAILLPRNAQGYQAQITHNAGPGFGNAPYTTQVSAIGYTRAELLDVLRSLGPPTLEAYLGQARLFAQPGQPDQAAFDALLGALASPTGGDARHFVERVYKRQNQQADALPDPYHRPPYGGWPEQRIQDNWSRGDDKLGTLERAASTTGDDGTLYLRQYLGSSQVWYYDPLLNRVTFWPTSTLGQAQRNNEDQNTLMRMLACGGAKLETQPDGSRRVVLTEDNWLNTSCVHFEYIAFFHAQATDDPQADPDTTPYLADITETTLTTVVDIAADGRARRIQVWAGLPESGTLLDSWELVSDEAVPAARVPATVFEANPPEALQRLVYSNELAEPAVNSVTITQALDLVQTPLFELPPAPALAPTAAITSSDELTPTNDLPAISPSLTAIVAGAPPETPRPLWYSDSNIFEQALRGGYAIGFTYSLTDTDGLARSSIIYQGSASALGAYLRGLAVWSSSSPEALEIGGKQIDGWRVTERRGGTEWLLFELDGTLIAVQEPSDELLAALTQMRQVAR